MVVWSRFTLTLYLASKSNVEADYQGISVLDHIFAAFEANLRRFAGLCPGAGGDDVLPVADLGGYKAALHVGVDAPCGMTGSRTLAHGPRAALLLAGRKESDKPEQHVSRPYEFLEA